MSNNSNNKLCWLDTITVDNWSDFKVFVSSEIERFEEEFKSKYLWDNSQKERVRTLIDVLKMVYNVATIKDIKPMLSLGVNINCELINY